jgi:hypothetical protein
MSNNDKVARRTKANRSASNPATLSGIYDLK